MDNTQLFLDPTFWLDPGIAQNAGIMEYPTGLGSQNENEDYLGNKRRKTRMRASRACIACRSRHTKCDGVEPICTRCQAEEKTCVYTKSRRGGSGRVLGGEKQERGRREVGVGASTDSQPSETHVNPVTASLSTSFGGRLTAFRHDSSSSDGTNTSISGVVDDGSYLNRYFEYFHNAHPVVLPRKKLLSKLQTNPESLQHLLPVLKYIGALYTPGIQTDALRQIAHQKLSEECIPKNAFSVQALLIFSLAIHCSDEYKAAEAYLDRAIDIALSINMDSQPFAWENAEGDAVLAESWRRTWWTLYSIDAIFAAISHYSNHRLQDRPGDVGLPCEDKAYNSGVCPFLTFWFGGRN